jgi:hypothetical protein
LLGNFLDNNESYVREIAAKFDSLQVSLESETLSERLLQNYYLTSDALNIVRESLKMAMAKEKAENQTVKITPKNIEIRSQLQEDRDRFTEPGKYSVFEEFRVCDGGKRSEKSSEKARDKKAEKPTTYDLLAYFHKSLNRILQEREAGSQIDLKSGVIGVLESLQCLNHLDNGLSYQFVAPARFRNQSTVQNKSKAYKYIQIGEETRKVYPSIYHRVVLSRKAAGEARLAYFEELKKCRQQFGEEIKTLTQVPSDIRQLLTKLYKSELTLEEDLLLTGWLSGLEAKFASALKIWSARKEIDKVIRGVVEEQEKRNQEPIVIHPGF